MLDKVRNGAFYVICPDNETKREVDELRIMWAAGDIVEGTSSRILLPSSSYRCVGRPALSRWHKDYKALFEEYVKEGLEAR